MASPTNSLETSLNNTGFTPDANEEETASSAAAETAETEESTSEETAEETREEGAEEGSEESTSSETAEGDEAAAEEEQPQGYDLMLPNQQLKNYPDELYQLAAKKFGVDAALLENKSVKDLLKGKINADIEIRNLRDRMDTGAEEDEAVAEDEEQPARAAAEPVAISPEQQLQATLNLLRHGPDGNTPIITREGSKLYA